VGSSAEQATARTGAALLQSRTESWVAAVNLVLGDPADVVSGVQEPFDHPASQVRFGREDGVLAESGCPAAVRVARPGARDVQLPVHRRVPTHPGVDEIDRDLGVLDPPAVPVYWRWAPTVWVPFFTSPVSSTTRTAASS
jgi:hypothetical protein